MDKYFDTFYNKYKKDYLIPVLDSSGKLWGYDIKNGRNPRNHRLHLKMAFEAGFYIGLKEKKKKI